MPASRVVDIAIVAVAFSVAAIGVAVDEHAEGGVAGVAILGPLMAPQVTTGLSARPIP